MSSISELTPCSLMQSPAKTGTKMRSAIAFDQQAFAPSCVSVSSPSKYLHHQFIVSLGHQLAQMVMGFLGLGTILIRISDSTAFGTVAMARLQRTRSMMPSKSLALAPGRVTAPRRVPKRSCSRSIVVAKLASERDRRFTNTARAGAGPRRHTRA